MISTRLATDLNLSVSIAFSWLLKPRITSASLPYSFAAPSIGGQPIPPPIKIPRFVLSGKNPLPRGPKISSSSPAFLSDIHFVPSPRTSNTIVIVPFCLSISEIEIGRRRVFSPHRTFTNLPHQLSSASSGQEITKLKVVLFSFPVDRILYDF